MGESSQDMTSWTYGKHIQAAFGEQGVSFDPATLPSGAWSESFDGCVGKWSSFLESKQGG